MFFYLHDFFFLGSNTFLFHQIVTLILLYLQAGIDTDDKDRWLCKNLQALLRFSGHYGDPQVIYSS